MTNTNPTIDLEREETKRFADSLAESQRIIADEQRKIFVDRAKEHGDDALAEAISKNKKYGFTLVCNTCGSTSVGRWERSRDGEYLETVLKCANCGQQE